MLWKNKSLVAIVFAFLFSLSLVANAKPVNDLLRQPNDPVAGNPKGKITVVEFFDYQCGHCASMAPVMSAIIKANPNVRVVFKEFPIRGPMSDFASRAALAANKQGMYYDFSHAMLSTGQPLTEELVLSLAKDQGLDINKLKKDMNSNSVREQIAANRQLGNDLQLSGTPAFFIGKTNATDSKTVHFVLGEMSQHELQRDIDKVSAA